MYNPFNKKTIYTTLLTAYALGSSHAATFATEVDLNLNMSYSVDQVVNVVSGVINGLDGSTFQISFDLAPGMGDSLNANNSGLGIGTGNDHDIDAAGDVIFASNIQVINFNANGGPRTLADISAVSFDYVYFNAANNNSDSGYVTANGDTGTWTDIDQSPADFIGHNLGNGNNSTNNVDFQLLTGDDVITSFEVGYANPNNNNLWQVRGVSVQAEMIPEPSTSLFLVLSVCGLTLRRKRGE